MFRKGFAGGELTEFKVVYLFVDGVAERLHTWASALSGAGSLGDRIRRYSLKTEKAYIHWVKRYLRFQRMGHLREMGAREVTASLNHLANYRSVAGAKMTSANRERRYGRKPRL